MTTKSPESSGLTTEQADALHEFLHARYVDEATALMLLHSTEVDTVWEASQGSVFGDRGHVKVRLLTPDFGNRALDQAEATATHVARWGPRRAQGVVEALGRIVGMYQAYRTVAERNQFPNPSQDALQYLRQATSHGFAQGTLSAWHDVMRAISVLWWDHVEYRAEWLPVGELRMPRLPQAPTA